MYEGDSKRSDTRKTRLPYNAQRTPFREKESFSRKGLTLKCKKDFFFTKRTFILAKGCLYSIEMLHKEKMTLLTEKDF